MLRNLLFSRVAWTAPAVALLLPACDTSSPESEAADEVSNAAAVGANNGYIYSLSNPEGQRVGTVEIKLHDDKGDLEVWINQGSLATTMLEGGTPWDLPLDSQLKVEFPGLEKEVTLAVRDAETNADEAGTSMIRESKTNYFIFPGDTGEDASWLQGHHFEESAVLVFEAEGAAVTTGTIKLVPHGHAHGAAGHDHPHPH